MIYWPLRPFDRDKLLVGYHIGDLLVTQKQSPLNFSVGYHIGDLLDELKGKQRAFSVGYHIGDLLVF